jgi:hypothetical protein
MKSLSLFKAAVAASVVSLLAACGGGGGTAPSAGMSSEPEVFIPFASPAMFVPPGAASKSVPLTACNEGLQTATLVINSSGDMILSGAPSGTTTISEIHRINYATAKSQNVYAANSPFGLTLSIYQEDATEHLSASINPSSSDFRSSKLPSYRCSMANGTSSFALTTLPSSARLASLMLSGITGITTTEVISGSFTGGVAFWDNWYSTYEANPSTTDESIRHFSLNMSTGAFGASPTPNVSGTAYVITLPTTPTSTEATFSESMGNGEKSFYLNVVTPSSGNLSVYFRRIGNLLRPEPCVNNYCD